MTQPGAGLWCNHCGEAVRLEGDEDEEPLLRRAVHARSGLERGEFGHVAAPIREEPARWAAVRRLRAQYGRWFSLDARFGLRADWANPPRGAMVAHYTASGPGAEGELREKLRAALSAAGIDPPPLPEAEEAAAR